MAAFRQTSSGHSEPCCGRPCLGRGNLPGHGAGWMQRLWVSEACGVDSSAVMTCEICPLGSPVGRKSVDRRVGTGPGFAQASCYGIRSPVSVPLRMHQPGCEWSPPNRLISHSLAATNTCPATSRGAKRGHTCPPVEMTRFMGEQATAEAGELSRSLLLFFLRSVNPAGKAGG